MIKYDIAIVQTELTRSNYAKNKSLTFDKCPFRPINIAKKKKNNSTLDADRYLFEHFTQRKYLPLFYPLNRCFHSVSHSHCDGLNLENDFSIRINLIFFLSLCFYNKKHNKERSTFFWFIFWHSILVFAWTDTSSVLHEHFICSS